jgi:hypothetical protein
MDKGKQQSQKAATKKRKLIETEEAPANKHKKNIGVKVDDFLWRRLRALAIKQGRLSGELLDEAIEDYLEKNGG